jgi:hypothetical protein
VHVMMTKLAVWTGYHFKYWGVGLSFILEKIVGVIPVLVNKLHTILLMEADFNFMNNFVFGSRMMRITRDSNMYPEEAFTRNKQNGQGSSTLQ